MKPVKAWAIVNNKGQLTNSVVTGSALIYLIEPMAKIFGIAHDGKVQQVEIREVPEVKVKRKKARR